MDPKQSINCLGIFIVLLNFRMMPLHTKDTSVNTKKAYGIDTDWYWFS